MEIPKELKYTSEHEWVKIKGDIAEVGITDFAQHELGDIVHFEGAEVGEEIEKGGILGTIDAVKTVADLYAPISGVVTEVNPLLDNEPEVVNTKPFTDGWMVRLKMTNPAELSELMDAEAYKALIAE